MGMLGRTLLLSGGRIDQKFAAEYVKGRAFDTVVCADSGLNIAARLGIPVDYLMGDFDSVSSDVLEHYREAAGSRGADKAWIQYPRRKDATDTYLVLEWIVGHGASEIVILGATGGRLDHFLANLNTLLLPLRQGIPAYILDPWNKIYLIDRDTVVGREGLYGKYISLHPLSGRVTGITLQGFEYPLKDFTLTAMGSSRTVSNELAEGAMEGRISLRDGILAVIESRD